MEINPQPPTVSMTQDQAVVCLYYDLAINMLASMANQLVMLKQDAAARQLARTADGLIEKRIGFVRRAQTGLTVIGAMPETETEQ